MRPQRDPCEHQNVTGEHSRLHPACYQRLWDSCPAYSWLGPGPAKGSKGVSDGPEKKRAPKQPTDIPWKAQRGNLRRVTGTRRGFPQPSGRMRGWSTPAIQILNAELPGFPSRTGSCTEGKLLAAGSEWKRIDQDNQKEERGKIQKLENAGHHIYVHRVKKEERGLARLEMPSDHRPQVQENSCHIKTSNQKVLK